MRPNQRIATLFLALAVAFTAAVAWSYSNKPTTGSYVQLLKAGTPYHRSAPRSVVWADSCSLLVADPNTTAEGASSIQEIRVHPDGHSFSKWFGSVATTKRTRITLKSPTCIAITSAGLWVHDNDARTLYLIKYPIRLGAEVLRKTPIAVGTLPVVTDLAPAPDSGVYALISHSGTILHINPSGRVNKHQCKELIGSSACVVGAGSTARSLLIANTRHGRIDQVPVSATGNLSLALVRPLKCVSGRITDVEVSKDGLLWLAEPDAASIHVYNPKSRAEYSIKLELSGETAYPWKLSACVTSDGLYGIAAADPKSGLVYQLRIHAKALRRDNAGILLTQSVIKGVSAPVRLSDNRLQ